MLVKLEMQIMVQFYKVKVAAIYKETKDCSVVTLDIPAEIQPAFQFKQGQHLTFKTQLDGQEVRRSYSLCSAPHEQKWQVAVKQIPGGLFSTYVNEQLQAGDEIEVMAPDGKFYVETQKEAAKNYIAFAAGSGITPMLSIIKTHLANEPHSTFKLFYLNRS
ncbi:MAG: FAD-binding oxidoreductase, partial [Flavobacterium sp.]